MIRIKEDFVIVEQLSGKAKISYSIKCRVILSTFAYK